MGWTKSAKSTEIVRNKKNVVNKTFLRECEEFIRQNLSAEIAKQQNLFLPKDDFYLGQDKIELESADFVQELLQLKTNLILQHLQVEVIPGELEVSFYQDMEEPGCYFEQEGKHIILINAKYFSDPLATGAILAHELMHFYLLAKKKVQFEDTLKNEILTDLCTIKFGLGIVILNGMSYSNNWFLTALFFLFGRIYWSSQALSFGYFNPYQYGKLVKENIIQARKLSFKEFSGFVYHKSRVFLCRLAPRFWFPHARSDYFKYLLTKARWLVAGKLVVLVAVFGFFYYLGEDERELKEQRHHIEELKSFLDEESPKMVLLEKELEGLAKQIDEEEALNGKSAKYETLIAEYQEKTLPAQRYNEAIAEHDAQIDNYNRKIAK
ncbi:MAG TPA: hypothetical protein PLQ36_01020 [Candidatus Gracilibacteria bacterium]|nr:hypothetical protein [Candidatus Gracilibacteria bacterium]